MFDERLCGLVEEEKVGLLGLIAAEEQLDQLRREFAEHGLRVRLVEGRPSVDVLVKVVADSGGIVRVEHLLDEPLEFLKHPRVPAEERQKQLLEVGENLVHALFDSFDPNWYAI